jgi:cytochrome c oxidase subunit I+III
MTDVDRRRTDVLSYAWDTRPGIVGWLGAVNHKAVGTRYVITTLAFFAIGGVLAVLMRIQLGAAENSFLSAERYNELFTMHGTTMMFLFAVPITEAIGIYFAPLLIGARDMPMPRVNAFGYWAYLFGGLFLYASFFTGDVPDGGWFAYTPLTESEFSPPMNLDFWLLGVTFVEVAGIVAAMEIVLLILKCRAPGMALSRMPLFAWSQLVTGIMILFAFPPLVAGSLMLELDRKLGTAFYRAEAGGDPELWQHIFWWFGHPEVYIMLLPALGIISMIIPTFARRPIIGYPLIATSTVAIGIVSFGLWAHHMFAVGIPLLALSYFAAGSFIIAIPSGIQVFAWIATLWRGTVVWSTPLLWVVGGLITFVVGGVTGVMVASVPFDWQAHDTYFVVAHFHYVIFGGVVYPVFAGLHYWLPKLSGRMPSERWGRIGFWLVVAGTTGTFFVQHFLGLLGMPRRIYTYPAGLDWEIWNLVSSVGAVVVATGFAVTVGNLLVGSLRGPAAGRNPWGGGTLEWATASPPEQYNFRRVPFVQTLDPLWEQERIDDPHPQFSEHAELADVLMDVRHPTREIVLTSIFDAAPERVVTLPYHSLWPLWLALTIGTLLLGALVDNIPLLTIGASGVVMSLVGWGWSREDQIEAPLDVHGEVVKT